MAKIISIANHKGGVGKTTTSVHIGVSLAEHWKKRVLLIDLDSQANLTMHFNIQSDEILTIYDLLKGERSIQDVIVEVDGLHIIPANLDLSGFEVELAGMTEREFVLKDILEPIKDNYDYIIIDCPPSLGFLTINALVASTDVFLAVQTEFFALAGIKRLIETIQKIQKRLNPQLRLHGVIATLFDKRRAMHVEVLDSLLQSFPNTLFKTPIRQTTALVDASSAGESIFKFSPKSRAALDYAALTKEIVKRYETKSPKAKNEKETIRP